eukprot:1142571-Pelagomonas_calceolata.AAC.3
MMMISIRKDSQAACHAPPLERPVAWYFTLLHHTDTHQTHGQPLDCQAGPLQGMRDDKICGEHCKRATEWRADGGQELRLHAFQPLCCKMDSDSTQAPGTAQAMKVPHFSHHDRAVKAKPHSPHSPGAPPPPLVHPGLQPSVPPSLFTGINKLAKWILQTTPGNLKGV